MTDTDMTWPQQLLPQTDIPVGLCAWGVSMLAGDDRDYVRAHPSMVVISPEDDDAVLIEAGPYIKGLPVLLGVAEPAFARQLEGQVMRRLGLLQAERVAALVLHVEDPAELKSGGVLQTMFALRDRGVVGCLGLAHPDAVVAEWLSMNAAVRLVGVGYSLSDQSARHRALPSVAGHGMSAFSLVSPTDEASVRFALGEARRVLPVLDRPIPDRLQPMSSEEVEQHWAGYQKLNPPPPALSRGRPPMAE